MELPQHKLEHLASALKWARMARSLTREGLAAATGVPAARIRAFELKTDQPHAWELMAVGRALGVPVGSLLGR